MRTLNLFGDIFAPMILIFLYLLDCYGYLVYDNKEFSLSSELMEAMEI